MFFGIPAARKKATRAQFHLIIVITTTTTTTLLIGGITYSPLVHVDLTACFVNVSTEMSFYPTNDKY